MLKYSWITTVMFFPVTVLAQMPSASPVAAAEAINKISSAIPSSIPPVWGYVIGVLGSLGVVDVLMRKYPSVKPRSILITVSAVLKSIDGLILKVDGLIESVLGQNLKQ